ncbi:MAG TPA: hypothetical protein VF585_06545 [Chthoniobacterales bacterium]|jgi:hypothetical protein
MARLLNRPVVTALLLILFGLTVRLVFSSTVYKYFIDDAYITMRYAENFARGDGLVYNVGERVIGFTSPLFQSLLAAAKYLFQGVSTRLLQSVFNYGFFAIAAWFAIQLFLRRHLLCAVPVLLLLYFPYIDATLSGLETTLVLAVIFGTLHLLAQERYGPAIVLATVSILVRPEGVFFLALVGLFAVIKGKQLYWKSVLLGAALLAVWVCSTYAYYGSVLAQSMLAKSAHVTQAAWGGFSTSPWDKNVLLAFGFSDISYVNWSGSTRLFLVVFALLGVALLCFSLVQNFREGSFLLIPPAFYLCAWAFYVAGQPIRIFSWYTIPTSLCFFIAVLDGCTRLIERIGWRIPRPLTMAAFALACIGSIAFALPHRADYLKRKLPEMERFAAYVGAIPGAKSIMLGDIGLVGYTSGLRVIDSVGLVSTGVLNLAPPGEMGYLSDLLRREQPSVVCLESDPATQTVIKQSERQYHTFRDAAEAEAFHARYERLPIPAGRYTHVYIERTLLQASRAAGQLPPSQ